MTQQKKKALVTGAGRGIGRACAIELAAMGIEVALVSRTLEQLLEVEAVVKNAGGASVSIPFDLSESGRLEELYNLVEEEIGEIDVLVNSAGVYKTDSLDSHNTSDWRNTLETNLTAPYILSQLVATGMKTNNWGRIVNISSISGVKAEAYGASYSASKFGLVGLTQSLALELASSGITVNAVCPGWVDTRMAKEQLLDEKWCKLNQIEQSESIEIAKLSVPQGRLLDPDEIAWLVGFLVSDRSKGITGQAINICGGMSIT